MHHKKRLLLLKLTKKICRTTAKYLDHIWMQYGIQSLQLPLATFQKVIMQHRTSINFLLALPQVWTYITKLGKDNGTQH